MSWWVKDFQSISEDSSEALVNIQCDAAADLPAADQTGTAGYTIVRGSKALDIATGDRYIMDSSGSWVKQPSEYQLDLTGYATQSWVSGELARYVQTTTYTTDQQRQETEIGVVAALGAKNALKITASSGVLNTATIDIAADGSIHITGQPTTNGAYVISSGIELVIPENSYILSMGAEAGNTKMTISLRRAGTSQYVDLYHAESRIIPAGTYDRAHIYLYADTVYDTHVYPMIRRAEITDSNYALYAPTNRELYEMILALQSGRSLQSAPASLMQAGRLDAELPE